MKATLNTFLIALALIPATLFAQPWTEDFNSQSAGSYGTGTLTINGRDWTRKDAGNFSYANSNMGSYAFTINDDKAGAHITTPVLNTCGTVSFKYAYINGNSSNVFQLQKSTDGTNYSTIDTRTLGASSNLSYVNYSFNVNESNATTYIRILSDNQNAHLFIEDFEVTAFGGGGNPSVEMSVSTSSASEAATTVVTVTATASSAVTGSQTVMVAISGTGITLGDYSLSNNTITIPNGGTTGSITFTVVDDALTEGTETATLTFNNQSSGIDLGSTISQDITILDNDQPLNTGDILFTAYNADGNDDFAFVTLEDIPANTSIWFTDNEWDGSGFNNLNEGEIEWSHNGVVPAGTVIVINSTAGSSPSASLGTAVGGGINLGASNEALFALLEEPQTTMVSPNFLAGIANDLSGSGATLAGTGLTSGTSFMDFGDDNDGYQYTGSRCSETSYAAYKPLIMNASNWQNEASDGTLILPIDDDSFVFGCTFPTLSVSPNSLTGFQTVTGTGSAPQTFTLSGYDLSPASGNITLTAPAGFQISTTNGSFAGVINVPYSGGTLSNTTIYVRISNLASAGSVSGDVTCSGGNASDEVVSFSGTVCPTPTGTFNVGDISIVGFSTDAPDGFAFVNWVSIPNGATLYFTDNAYENGVLATNENTVEWNNNTGSAIVPGTVIVYTDGSGFDLGTDISGGVNGLSSGGDNLFIYEGSASCPEFVYGFSNSPWVTSGSASNNDSYLPSVLNVANGNLNVSSEDNWQYSAPRNDQNLISNYKPLVNDASNWTGDNNNFTLSSTDFIIASANPSVELSASASSGSEAATSSVTFTATASSAVIGDQTVTLSISGTGITAGDYTVTNGGVITILDGNTTGSVTFTVVDDADIEGSETATIEYTAGGLSAGLTVGTTTSLNFDIADNDGTTLYSQTSGGTNSAIWDIIPNGVGQSAGTFGGFSEFVDVVIQTGHTVDITVSGLDMKSLTVQSGGKIYADNGASPEYIDLYGNVTNNGIIGNGNTTDFISFNFMGNSSITFSGSGSYDIGRMRKNSGTSGNVIIDADINLNYPGACIYNNNANSTYNLTINSNRVVELTDVDGDVSIDGVDGTAGTNRGGSITVNGKLIVPDKLYAKSNNTTLGCSIYIGSSGHIIAQDVLTNIDGTGFGTFGIASGGKLEVNGLLDIVAGSINSNGGLILNSGATLLHGAGTPGGGGFVSGNVTVKRQGSPGNIYNYWSTPVSSSQTVPGTSIFHYDSNLGTQDYSDDAEDPGWIEYYGGTMDLGKGYASKDGDLASFFGPVNNGNITTPLSHYPLSPGNTDPGTPFNLVGNPYPGAISASTLVSNNPSISGSIYFWDDDLSGGSGYSYTDYAVWNGTGSLGTGAGTTPPNGYIASCQGFLVRTQSAGNLTFTNSMRVSGPNDLFFRQSEERSRLWLSMEGNNGLYNEILIGMLEEATESEDRLYDAIKMRGNLNVSLSAMNENREYAILAFPHPIDEKIIPLNVMVGVEGTYDFSPRTMENLDGYDIYFEDNQNGNLTLLVEESDISVALSAGEYINRFFLHFVPRSTTGLEEFDSSKLIAYESDGRFFVQLRGNEQSQGTLQLLNAEGQLVSQRNQVELSNPIMVDATPLSSGMYFLRFVSDRQVFTSKIMKR